MKIKLLLIEDSENDALLILRNLKKGGYEAIHERITSAQMLYKALDTKDWDVIICDYNLPGFSGLEALEIVKNRKLDIPFIIVSGAIGEDTAVEAMKSGAHDYILKENLSRLVPAIEREIKEAWIRMEQKQAEEALKRSEYSYRTLAENLPAIPYRIFLKNNNWTQFFNDMVEPMTGYRGEELSEGNNKSIFNLILPEDRTSIMENLKNPLKSNKPFELTYRIKTKDGSIKYFFERGRPVYEANGEPLFIDGVIFDITEQKHNENQKRKLESQLQQLQKLESLGVLAGGIAHDFNNILTGILGYADLAIMELSPLSPAQEYLKQVIISTRNAADLTKQMLAYAGKGKFIIQPIKICDLIKEMAYLIEVSVSKKCILKYHFEESLPPIQGDISQLRQVIMNLVVNASESMENKNGIISINTGLMECDEEYLTDSYINENLRKGKYVYLEVADTGCGMTEDIKEKIFDPFFSTKFTGRGLGLAAVMGIVRGHKGAIKISTKPGHGSSFKILFPTTDCLESEIDKIRSKPIEHPDEKGTVLVIDDELTVRKIAKTMLERGGFTILTASDGAEGLKIFKANLDKIKFVILDLTMPNMDGEETYNELKKIKDNVKIILTSGYNEQDTMNKFKGKDLSGFIQKPFRYNEIMNIISQIKFEK